LATRSLVCIVLAAGGSKRFGARKQLENLAGESLAHRAVRAAIECNPAIVLVVIGADAEKVQRSISDYASIEIVINDNWQSGLASSIVAGLRAVENRTNVDGILITLADQPLVDSSCLRRLLDKFDNDNRIVASAYHGAVGVPAVIGIEHIHELMNLSGDRGAGSWLKQRLASVIAVPMPEAAMDIDTPQDLEHLKSELGHDV
jgi:molybdenum cofactor cytidylyltransferase